MGPLGASEPHAHNRRTMAPPRRGGRSRTFGAPELRGTLGTLLRTTLAQAGAVRDAIERSAREGRARIDDALLDRRRAEAISELGEIVLELIRKGELRELAEVPEIADALSAIDEVDARTPRGARDRRDDEPGRDWIAPDSRSRFDRGRSPDPDAEGGDGTVSSRSWSAPRASKPQARVWRPSVDDTATTEEKLPRRNKGGIDFAATDDDAAQASDDEDLSAYMHPDDVPDREPKK